MIACLGCGMSLRFDPEKQRLVCDYCGNTYFPEELKVGKDAGAQVSYEDETASETENVFEGTLFTCPQCGGEILSDSDTAVTFCSYCGVSVALEGRTVKMKAPSYVIPFKRTKEECKAIYKRYINGAVFAPKYMKEEGQLEKLRGIYMPYWIYEFQYDGPLPFTGSKHYRRGDYLITDHYRLDAGAHLYYKGVSFDASSSFSDTFSQSIAPYDISECRDFAQGYISGFYADTADVDAIVYDDNAKAAAAEDASILIRQKNPILGQYSSSDATSTISSSLQTKNSMLSYFPVWFMSIRHKDKVSYAVINGQTGKVAADIPIDYKKYILYSLLLSLPIMAVMHIIIGLGFGFSVNPITFTTLASIIFAVTAYIIANGELNLLYTRNNNFDDEGYLIKNNIRLPKQAGGKKPAKAKVSSASAGSNTIFYIGIVLFGIAAETEIAPIAIIAVFLFIVGLVTKISLSTSATKTPKVIKKGRVFKQPFEQKLPVLIKPLIAIGVGLVSFIDKFLNINLFYLDFVKYAFLVVELILIMLCFFDIVSLHNKLTTHLPKQFNKRGGDE